MSLTIEQTDSAIRNTFYNMEQNVEYVLNDFWFRELNRLRKEYHYPVFKHIDEYKIVRKGDKLFANDSFVFDFLGKNNLAFSFTFSLIFVFAFALLYNGIEKLNKDTCDGKVVEIDGKKYKLTAV